MGRSEKRFVSFLERNYQNIARMRAPIELYYRRIARSSEARSRLLQGPAMFEPSVFVFLCVLSLRPHHSNVQNPRSCPPLPFPADFANVPCSDHSSRSFPRRHLLSFSPQFRVRMQHGISSLQRSIDPFRALLSAPNERRRGNMGSEAASTSLPLPSADVASKSAVFLAAPSFPVVVGLILTLTH